MSDEVTPKSTSSVQPEEQQGNAAWLLVAFGILMAALIVYGVVSR